MVGRVRRLPARKWQVRYLRRRAMPWLVSMRPRRPMRRREAKRGAHRQPRGQAVKPGASGRPRRAGSKDGSTPAAEVEFGASAEAEVNAGGGADTVPASGVDVSVAVAGGATVVGRLYRWLPRWLPIRRSESLSEFPRRLGPARRTPTGAVTIPPSPAACSASSRVARARGASSCRQPLWGCSLDGLPQWRSGPNVWRARSGTARPVEPPAGPRPRLPVERLRAGSIGSRRWRASGRQRSRWHAECDWAVHARPPARSKRGESDGGFGVAEHLGDVALCFDVGRYAAVLLNGSGPGVVGGQGIFGVAADLAHQLAQVARSAFDRFGRVEWVCDTHRRSGARHQLCQTACPALLWASGSKPDSCWIRPCSTADLCHSARMPVRSRCRIRRRRLRHLPRFRSGRR